jgi:hypothetical protein
MFRRCHLPFFLAAFLVGLLRLRAQSFIAEVREMA